MGKLGASVLIGFLLLASSCGGGGGSADPDGGGGGGGDNQVMFLPGSLPEGTTVTVTEIDDPAALADFDADGILYQPAGRADRIVRVTTGKALPSGDAVATLTVPVSLPVPAGQTAIAFARIPTGNDDESHDGFEPIQSVYAAGKVVMQLPPIAFSAARTSDGTVEALLLVATVSPTFVPFALRVQASGTAPGSGDQCIVGSRFRPPVARPLVLTSPLSSDRSVTINGETRNGHPGIDLRSATGDSALAPLAGTVLASYTSTSYGETVVLSTARGNVRVAHLSERRVAKGAAVEQGEVLGTTGSTGFSTATLER